MKKFLRPIYWELYKRISRLKKQRPVFIVGCGHSGTTLLLRVLASHTDLYCIPFESDAFNTGVTRYKLFNQWEKERLTLGKKTWVEKTPRHILYLDKIFTVFPNAKVIYIVRDGRDTAMSLKKRFGDINIGIDRWVSDNTNGLKFMDDDRVYCLRLEDFVVNTSLYLQEMCKHINVEFIPNMEKDHSSNFNYQKATSDNFSTNPEDHKNYRNWQINQPIKKDTSRWEKESTKEEKQLFIENQEFQELLKVFKYE